MLEAIQNPFFVQALIAGVLASVACGMIGTYVVLRRMTYLAGSISHASFGGIGISLYLGIHPFLGASVFGVFASIIMGVVRNKVGKNRDDTLIGALWAIGMSIGIIFAYLAPGYTSDLMSYLFGNILLATDIDLMIISGLSLILFVVMVSYHQMISLLIADEECAKIMNLPVNTFNILMLVLLSLTVVALVKIVGLLLVITLISLPAASAEYFSSSIKGMMVRASLIGAFSTILGLFISYAINIPSGPFIIVITFICYILSILRRKKPGGKS